MTKNIVFCADGTWNGPGRKDDDADEASVTNVLKLYDLLSGVVTAGTRQKDEQEKTWSDAGGVRQIAKYLHGVGDSQNFLVRLIGGAFGAGTITRIVRGYTFLSRNYQPGDAIFIVGFSRGAYTARALAGLIASQGLLRSDLAQDKEKAYRRGAQAWYRYRDATKSGASFPAHLAEVFSDLPGFVTQGDLKPGDLSPVDAITAVGVWDTVGSLGFPDYVGGQRKDAFAFANNTLSDKVRFGFQALALDERRDDFTPAVWDTRAGVEQAVFPGAHADVGGGYPVARKESGLSDHALQWMVGKLQAQGVSFDLSRAQWAPDAAGQAHEPWSHAPWNFVGVKLGARKFPSQVGVDAFVPARKAVAAGVSPEPGKANAAYDPRNIPQ